MPFFSRFFLGAEENVCMPTVPTDEIYPVHFFDDTQVFRKSQGVWLIRFDDVLDPAKVHGGLERLCTLPGWRKCGGRVRINVNPPSIFTLSFDRRLCANACDRPERDRQIGDPRPREVHCREASSEAHPRVVH